MQGRFTDSILEVKLRKDRLSSMGGRYIKPVLESWISCSLSCGKLLCPDMLGSVLPKRGNNMLTMFGWTSKWSSSICSRSGMLLSLAPIESSVRSEHIWPRVRMKPTLIYLWLCKRWIWGHSPSNNLSPLNIRGAATGLLKCTSMLVILLIHTLPSSTRALNCPSELKPPTHNEQQNSLSEQPFSGNRHWAYLSPIPASKYLMPCKIKVAYVSLLCSHAIVKATCWAAQSSTIIVL